MAPEAIARQSSTAVTNPEAISGRISDRPVAELLQWLHETRGTGQARFRTALGSATVWLRDGEIVDADMGRFHGDAAVLRLMRIQDGEYEVEPKPVNQRRSIKASTAQLLAEGRQRAPKPGPTRGNPVASSPSRPPAATSGSGSGSGEYSHVRDDSRPRRAEIQDPAPEPPRRGARGVDTGAHTLINAKPVPRPPARPQPGAPAEPATSRTPSVSAPVPDPARGPAARRRGPGWSPTQGHGVGSESPEPQPPQPAPPPESPTRSGRTQFMFGVSGPGASAEPAAAPTASTPAPAEGLPQASPRAPRFGAASSPRAAATIATRSAPKHAVAPPTRSTEGTAQTTEARRRRPRAVARAQAPFEPERADRTLLRAGPLPPPPGQPVVLPVGQSGAIALTPAAAASARAPAAAPAPRAYPEAVPVLINEEYSHPISVPTDPSHLRPSSTSPSSPDPSNPGVGPGGTWALVQSTRDRPLPDDPEAEATVTMRAPDALQPREPSLSSHVKSGGTAHVGRYEVLLRLARGGMGTVYLCRVTGEGGFRRLFALKVIRDHLNTNQAYVQMLLEEARIASRLSHPNIVSIIDIDTFANQHFLVMDYVEGCTLSELLKAHPKTRPPELIVPIMLDALTGLHAAHSMRGDDGSLQPVVHCDFSPQNMLVGVNGTCRLTDFGVSKAANALQEGPGRGKPGYLSPEQVRGLALDPRSDVFSAGVVLWNALTGEQLFEGDDPQQVLAQVISRKIPKPSSTGLRPPAYFDRICMKALERDPALRYQSAEQMLTELRKVAIAEDLLAPSSEVGRWVHDTFGAQIELRRQAAGLAPNLAVATMALRDLASAGPTGHSESMAHDGSATGHDPNASMTMMIRSEAVAEGQATDREGLGPRSRVVVVVAALAFMLAAVVTLFVRPDLLQGGIMDENGQYIDLSNPADRQLPLAGTSGGPAIPEGDDTTGEPADPAAESTGDDTDDTTDDTTDATDTEAVDPDAEAQPAGLPSRGKGKPGARGDTEPPPTDKGKGKGKSDGGSSAPPPDLDELFRPPGG